MDYICGTIWTMTYSLKKWVCYEIGHGQWVFWGLVNDFLE